MKSQMARVSVGFVTSTHTVLVPRCGLGGRVKSAYLRALEYKCAMESCVMGRLGVPTFAWLAFVIEMGVLLAAPKNGGWLLFSLCVLNRFLSGASEAAASGADEAVASLLDQSPAVLRLAKRAMQSADLDEAERLSDEIIVLNAHVDAWFDGAGDNGDGERGGQGRRHIGDRLPQRLYEREAIFS